MNRLMQTLGSIVYQPLADLHSAIKRFTVSQASIEGEFRQPETIHCRCDDFHITDKSVR